MAGKQVSLSFPDQTYTSSNKPSTTTLKTDLSSIETQHNSLDNAVIEKDGSVAYTGNQSMGGNLLTGLGAPSNNNDAARKTYVDAAVAAAIVSAQEAAHPVGSVYLAVVATNPATLLGFGTWSQIAEGKMLVGQTDGDADFNEAEETGGSKTHTLTEAEMPTHTHIQNQHRHTNLDVGGARLEWSSRISTGSSDSFTAGSGGAPINTGYTTPTNQTAGSGSAHSIINTYFVVYARPRTQKHGESLAHLLSAGVDPRTIGQYWMQRNQAKGGGSVVGTIDKAAEIADIYKMQQQKGVTGVEALKDQKYAWDPNKFLPGIQGQSGAIYDPQMQQMQALQQLGQSQASEQRLRTQEEFDKRMQAEQEAMNQRGAFFSGGAIRGEQDIRNEQMRLLQQQDLQAQAAYQESLARQGGLAYEQSQFEKQALFGEEAGAYGRWKDDRDYNYMFETNERDYATQALMGATDAWRARNQFDLSVSQFRQAQKEFETTSKQWDKQFAWNKFMYNNAQK
jgi:hypothetical protein